MRIYVHSSFASLKADRFSQTVVWALCCFGNCQFPAMGKAAWWLSQHVKRDSSHFQTSRRDNDF